MAAKRRVFLYDDFRNAGKDVPELLAGGVGIRGPFPASDVRRGWFQTLVQADGDLCLSIHTDALTSTSFEDDIRQHIRHVHQKLGSTNIVRAILHNLNWVLAGIVLGVTGVRSIFELVILNKGVVDLLSDNVVIVCGIVGCSLALFSRFFVMRATLAIFRHLMHRHVGEASLT